MWHEVLSCLWQGKGISQLFVFQKSGPEYISKFMNRQRFSQNHFVESLRHASQHDLMTTHEWSVQKFVDERVLVEFSAKNMLTDGINEKRSDLLPGLFLVLQKGVGVSIETIFVWCFLWQCIVNQHIQHEQVNNRLLPSYWSMRVNLFNTIKTIVFNFS